MRRKILIGLSVLAAVLCTLYSCIQEDFASQETTSQRNAAEFFKHSKTLGANARAGVDYVEILEAYNEEYNFLAQMPDQQGMPIWEKMQVIDAEETIGLMIPLSHDNETLSSVLFATLDARYSVTGVKDYDNELLENIVYDAKISRDFREQMLYTFMYIDNKTFGTEQFTGIPADLFVGKKYDDRYGRIWLKDFGSPQTVHAESSKILYIETCGSSWSCKNHESWSKCDHCAACYTTSCGITIIWISDDTGFPPATGTGGGGGGTGGGGSTTPGPAQPPTDPCSLSVQAFYRLKPGCLDSGNPDLPDFDDSCSKLKSLTDNTTYKNNIAHLKGKTSDDHESGWRMNYPIPNGSTNDLLQNAPGSNFVNLIAFGNTYALLHSHYDGLYPIFSPDDIILFNQWVNVVVANNQIPNPNVPIPPVGEITFTLVTSQGNYIFMFDETVTPSQFPSYTQKELDALNDTYILKYLDYSYTNGVPNIENLEKEFLKFVRNKMNFPGLKLYKSDSTGNTEIYLDGNTRKTKKCL